MVERIVAMLSIVLSKFNFASMSNSVGRYDVQLLCPMMLGCSLGWMRLLAF